LDSLSAPEALCDFQRTLSASDKSPRFRPDSALTA
jgi:hypothetical protein